LRQNIVRMIEEYGTNNIYAFHLSTGIQFGPNDEAERSRKPLRVEDAQAITDLADAVETVSNVLFVQWADSTVNYKGKDYRRGQMQGVSPNYARTANVTVQEGRFINEVDEQFKRDVMVVGVNVAQALFPDEPRVVGTQVKLGGRPFEIIGVLEKRKSGFFGENEEDNAIFLPFQTARKISPGSEYLMLVMRARTGRIVEALDQVEEILRRQRHLKFTEPNNFDLSTADKFIDQFDNITKAVGLIAIAISSVGLLVGGIGVMNIMLVSVTERTQEIGVRKALGARRKDIVNQFLFEAMTLTFLGGLLGVVIAIAISQLIMLLVPSLPATIPLWAVASGLTVSIGIGLVFGVWPAKKASKLDPIECLRYE
ncbi:MAG TPA: ABC transporter permease, partial [Pyrinomonadaceae bacterium]|nr:ABC transporter permease [Pyrinomonadaceae bacterium]